MSFSKDAETGVYLACNKAFAAYAQKTHPNEVIGLTDGQIFQAQPRVPHRRRLHRC
ncbi:MAG: hypothetical protein ABTB30_09725 [Clostridia bacterium]